MVSRQEAIDQAQQFLQDSDDEDFAVMVDLDGDPQIPGSLDYAITFHGAQTDSLFTEGADSTDGVTARGTVRGSQDPNGLDVWVGTPGTAGAATVVNTIGAPAAIDLLVWIITPNSADGPHRIGTRERRVFSIGAQEVTRTAAAAGVGLLGAGAAVLLGASL